MLEQINLDNIQQTTLLAKVIKYFISIENDIIHDDILMHIREKNPYFIDYMKQSLKILKKINNNYESKEDIILNSLTKIRVINKKFNNIIQDINNICNKNSSIAYMHFINDKYAPLNEELCNKFLEVVIKIGIFQSNKNVLLNGKYYLNFIIFNIINSLKQTVNNIKKDKNIEQEKKLISKLLFNVKNSLNIFLSKLKQEFKNKNTKLLEFLAKLHYAVRMDTDNIDTFLDMMRNIFTNYCSNEYHDMISKLPYNEKQEKIALEIYDENNKLILINEFLDEKQNQIKNNI